jgi:hypothetical protein
MLKLVQKVAIFALAVLFAGLPVMAFIRQLIAFSSCFIRQAGWRKPDCSLLSACIREMNSRMIIKQAAAPEVAEDVAGLDLVGRVIAPRLRVTDSHIESVELGLGFGLGRRIHPGESIN